MRWIWWAEADMLFDALGEQSESWDIPDTQEFEEFCKSASGALLEWSEWLNCKWEGFECTFDDYSNQNCNWEKKN
jgi:hypothetical protein